MACVEEIRVGDEKTSIELAIKECNNDGTYSVVDISGAQSLVMRFQKPTKPTKTSIDKPAVVFTGGPNGDGTDGIVQYITESGFVDIKGTWKVQAIATFQDGGKFHSSIETITVVKNLPNP